MKMNLEKKLVIFGVLNIVQGLVVGLIPLVVPSRIDLVNSALMVAGGIMFLSGPLLVFAGKWGRRIAAAACLIHWIVGLTGVVLVLSSASYLYGIYGRHGASAGLIAFVIAFVLMIVFWFIPAHEISFLRGRRDPE